MTSGSPPTPPGATPPQQPPRSRATASRRSPLTPNAALGWLRSLSIDLRALAILDADGAVLAGDPALARAGEGGLVVARSGQHAIVVRPGPKALERLVRADLQAALEALEPR
jgi:hypothetical protein